jgi:hypothetical protein
MKNRSMEEVDHNRSARIHFYQMGLWNRDGYIYLDKKRPDVAWKVLTLESFYNRFKSIHGELAESGKSITSRSTLKVTSGLSCRK